MKHGMLALCLMVLAAPMGCASFPKLAMPSFGKKPSEATERMLSMARLMERHGKNEEALKIYEKVLEKYPNQWVACHRLGVLAVRRGEHQLALEYFDRAKSGTKPSAELLNDIGYTQYLTHDLETAEQTLREALVANPHFDSARTNLGLVLAEQGRETEALAEFRKAVSESEALTNLAFVQTKLGKLSDAEKNYHRALELNSKNKAAAEALVQYQMARDKAAVFVAELERQEGGDNQTATVAETESVREIETEAESRATVERVAAVIPAAATADSPAKKSSPPTSETTFLPPRHRHPLADNPANEEQAQPLFSPPQTEFDDESTDRFEWAEPEVSAPDAVTTATEAVNSVPLLEELPGKPAPSATQTWSSQNAGVVRLKR